jgi:hypothetical protein
MFNFECAELRYRVQVCTYVLVTRETQSYVMRKVADNQVLQFTLLRKESNLIIIQ